MFAPNVAQPHIISDSVIIGAANIICRRQTSFKKVPFVSRQKRLFCWQRPTKLYVSVGKTPKKVRLPGPNTCTTNWDLLSIKSTVFLFIFSLLPLDKDHIPEKQFQQKEQLSIQSSMERLHTPVLLKTIQHPMMTHQT